MRRLAMTGSRWRLPLVLTDAMQLVTAFAVLTVGASTYVLVRGTTPWQITDLPLSLALADSPVASSLGLVLPTLAHAYAFSVLLALALGPSRKDAATGCVAWCGVEIVLEFLQLAQSVVGTFDRLDLVAAVLGSAAAWISLLAGRRGHAVAWSHESTVHRAPVVGVHARENACVE